MSEINIDPKEFQKSITRELDIIKNRVRNLIGDAHWGEEGRYKEAVLKNILRRFLPSNLSIGTGFIVNRDFTDFTHETQISSQIDIIIYDNNIPVLFSEGDFVITTYKNVKGIIEVKTKIRNSELREILQKIERNGQLIKKKIFNGLFAYEYEDNMTYSSIVEGLKNTKGYVNHISLGPDLFIKFWKRESANNLSPPVRDCKNDFFNIYRIEELSFSYFISNLLELTSASELDDRWWFLYPIEGGKERNRIKTICLNYKNET